MSNPTPTLEQKIAAALTAVDLISSDLSQLLIEADAAIAAADSTAEEERIKALDPALSPDPKQAREAMQDAEFVRDRLKTLLPRLEMRLGLRRASKRRCLRRRSSAYPAGPP